MSDNRIAIVGIGCRVPGARDAEGLWRIVREGADAMTSLGESDLLEARVPRSAIDDPRYVRRASVLEGIESFDAAFFGLSAQQAELLDPQHRAFFECAWEALEDAGLPPENVRGSVGVFGGCSVSSYLLFNLLPSLQAGASAATLLAMIGNEKDYLPTHLSYLLGLKGPSVGVQSACSTSLAAVHLACQSLLSGECDLALAGGASVRVPHRVGYRYEEGSILSPSGHCRSFDAAADGTVFGSGAGVVALCRLEDAIARGDRVHAVILGSALNNDGDRKAGYTAPSVDGQASVIAEALAVAGATPDSIQLIEAHGTGTPIGDPIEVKALAEALRGAKPGSIALSAAKASFGHLEAAAGITGFIAATMALAHRELPPIAHFREPNPLLRLDTTPLTIARSARAWPRPGTDTGDSPRGLSRVARRAGVSSFGIGGTNVHVVLEEAPAALARAAAPGGWSVICASARTESALRENVKQLTARLDDAIDLAAASRTSTFGRRAFEHRVAIVARDAKAARDKLSAAQPVRAVANAKVGAVVGVDEAARRASTQLRQWGLSATAYADAAAARAAGCTALLVFGTRPADSDGLLVVDAMDRDDATHGLLTALATLHAHGIAIDWRRVLGDGPRASLPTYPFERIRHWREAPDANAGEGFPGREIATPLAARMLYTTLRPESARWLADHRVEGRVVMPAAAFASLALEAGLPCLRTLSIEHLLAIDAHGTPLQTVVDANGRVEIHALSEGEWRRHASAERAEGPTDLAPIDIDAVMARCAASVEPATMHRDMAANGIELGATLQRFTAIHAGDDECIARLRDGADIAADGLRAHPALLDALFQSLAVVAARRGAPAHLPVSLDALHLAAGSNLAQAAWCHARMRPTSGAIVGDLAIADASGRVLLKVEGLACRPAARAASFMRDVYVPQWLPSGTTRLAKPGTPVARTFDLQEHAASLDDIDRLCSAWLARAFEQLGACFEIGKPLAIEAPTAARFERLWPRLWAMLEADGIIDASRRVVRLPETDAQALHARLSARHPSMAQELDMLARCGRSLAAVLRGEADPLALLFGGQGATSLYAQSRYSQALYELAADALAPLATDAAKLRVLEVGGGTGGATGAVLDALAGKCAEYLFTDVSPAFLAAARERFAAHPCLDTALVNLEQDLTAQGIEKGSRHLVVASNVLHATTDIARTLERLRDALLPGGWIVLVEGLRPSRWLDLTFALTDGWWNATDRARRPGYPLMDETGWRAALADCGYDTVQVHVPGSGRLADQAVIVARRSIAAPESTRIAIEGLDAAHPASAVLEALQRDASSQRLIVATCGAQAVRPWESPDPAQAAVTGLVRAAALERRETFMRIVDLDPLADDRDRVLALEAAIDDREAAVAWRDGQRHVLRLRRPVAAHPQISEVVAPSASAGTVVIEVRAAGLNFKDVLVDAGAVESTAPLGGECAGVVVAIGEGSEGFAIGQRVMALAGGSFASRVAIPAQRVVPIPAAMSFEQAGVFPISAVTAFHALRELAALRRGERVLIHLASGGVGQHAVALAQAIGAEVFATAGSTAKRAWLRRQGIEHVFDSRSTDFAPRIREATHGEGVDVVLNSLTGDAIEAALSTLRAGGRFIELGRVGILSGDAVAKRYPHVRYDVVALDRIDDAEGARLLRAALHAHEAGELARPPLTRFEMSELPAAMQYMRQAKHVGRIVLTREHPWSVRADRSYLVTGGLGGLGLALAGWLVERGARHLVLAGRNVDRAEAISAIEALRARGARVELEAMDVADAGAVARVAATFGDARPPLAAIFHAAGALDDAPLRSQDAAKLAALSAIKLGGARNLARHCAGLDAFVMFSSAAGLLGSAGQANHAAASAALDAFARSLRAQGVNAITIDWGPWARIGAAARLQVGDRLSGTGMGEIAPAEGLAMLGWMLDARRAQAAMLPIDWKVFRANAPRIFDGIDDAKAVPSKSAVTAPDAPLTHELATLPSTQRAAAIEARVMAEAARLMGTGGAIPPDRALTDIGLDSLQAIELRNRLGKLAGVSLPATLIFDYPSVRALAWHLATLLEPTQAMTTPARKPEPRRTAAASAAAGEDAIAVIGIGCRMPGGAEDVDAFWRLLEDGVDAVVDVPPERWDVDAWYDPDPDAPGKMNTRRGGFLRDVDKFDAAFFGISPREATSMDPQQRIVLEVAWRALEHAGVPPLSLEGSRTGVYLGLCTSDYTRIGDGVSGMGALDTYSGTGGANGVAAGRLSYTLGLAGPSLVVDTACSSSLVAAHLAVQALRTGECNLALAGGVNLVLLPDGTVTLSRLHMMAPDGRCKAFDESADGFVRGEGCGIVVLKRLPDAMADGDRVLAVIRGTAMNQDGRSAGLTAPSGLAQQAVVREALADARVDPADVTYVECHGTGTSLGDPIEINALATTLSPGRARALTVGSVKTNIGHLEAAAGVAGLIKAIESVRRGRIAPSLHFTHINPHIRTGDCTVEVATRAGDWPAGAPPIAGVSAFGFSGTNVHMVVEAPPPTRAVEAARPQRGSEVLPLSARDATALASLKDAVQSSDALEDFADACYSASAGRSAFAHRLAIVAANRKEALEKLSRASPRVAGTPRIAFLFSGQGAQASGMGRVLYETEPVFREALDRCATVLDPLLGRSLATLMFEGGEEIHQTRFAQPALVAFELAMVDLLREWSVEPEAVLGHSLGEFAAAAVAGCAERDAILRLVAARGRLMQALPPGGAMAAVMAPRAHVESLLADKALSLAADNGPSAVTISGPGASVERALATLEARGIGVRRLQVSHAFHSALMDPMLGDFEREARAIEWRAAGLTLVGNVEGEAVVQPSAGYWRRHVREPVAFAAGIRKLAALGCDTFVEIGPNPVLLGMGRACVGSGEWIAASRHGSEAAPMEALARLFECGVDVRWDRVHAGRARRLVTFPGHPLQRESYWKRTAAATMHPLLETRVDLPDGRCVFRARLPASSMAFLAEHRVGGIAIVPAAALLEACAAAASRRGKGTQLSSISLHAALALDAPREITIEIDADRVTLESRAADGAGEWTRHVSADIGGDANGMAPIDGSVASEPVDTEALYAWMRSGGIEHGALFRRLQNASRGDGIALARLDALPAGRFLLHPALLDSALQAIAAATFGTGDGRMRIPVRIDAFSIEASAHADAYSAQVRLFGDEESPVADVLLCDGAGAVVAKIVGVHLAESGVRAPWRDWLLERVWREVPAPLAAKELATHAAAFASDETIRKQLAPLDGLGRAMDRVAAAYARQALRDVAEHEVASKHRALYRRLPLLASAGDDEHAAALLDSIRARHPGCEREIALLERCGRELAAVLKGERDPLQLLFPADSDDNVYRDSPVSRALNRGVEDALQAALPAQGPIRILEVGAGTGGTTESLLARLPGDRLEEYAFTDISPSLLAAARRRYASKPWLVTRTLDIDGDPQAQGFAADRYHAIVAANVLHAGRDLAASLTRLASLLVPGGALILLEGAGPQGWIDLVFGLTEGWWRFADHQRRPDYPLPDRAGWLDVMLESGFDAAIAEARIADTLERQAILVARRASPRWLVVGGDDALTRTLASELNAPRIELDAPIPQGHFEGCVLLVARTRPGDRSGTDRAGQSLRSVPSPVEAQRAAIEAQRRVALACSERGMRLAVVTSGAHAKHAEQSMTWGLARGIAAELPDLAVRLIDVDPSLDASDAATRLAGELRANDGEDQVVLAREVRQAARLARVEAAPAPSIAIDRDAAYLISGGFGGLGLHAARWLASRGARHLVLMGRSPPSAKANDAIAQIESSGVTVHRSIGDVAEEGDVQAALTISQRRIAGVVHAAGTLDDGVLAQLEWPRIERVLRAKVTGAWLIDRLAGPLDFLLLYSSAVGLVGSRGQANHVAANAYLDALAAQRRLDGQHAVSIAWGAWSGIGSATDADLRRRMQRSGMDPIVPGQATPILDWALTHAPACVGVLPIRWPAFTRALEGRVPPILRELLPEAPTSRPVVAAEPKAQSAAREAAVRMLDIVLEEAAEVLAASSPAAIDPARSLFELGLDSLMAVELRNRLQKRLARALPSTLLFDHPAPAALSEFLGPSMPAVAAREKATNDEPIAIIGMDCRLPGGATNPDRFWQLLDAGFDAIGELPASRADGSRAKVRIGAFLEDVDRFDAAFFRIAPREAASMDPQQRMLLETAWHALERSGQAPDALAGSATGVFIGVCNYDYPQLVSAAGHMDAWSATGGAPSIVAGRLAYTLGLEGPAMVIDTACSSSLVSVHLACRSLAEGECDMALAGGVNLILAPSSTDALSALQMLAPDGRCKAFDSRADGFVRGEGCGVVVLKRLSDAEACGDRILAVIRGSAVNQDGRSPSLTAPSGRSQERVIRNALARAGVEPADVGYVETHGTGTQLGDPIEMHALKAVFAGRAEPLFIGAVKSNVGHLEAAAGIAGLMKATLAVANSRIPPNLHLREINPHIALEGLPAAFPSKTQPWDTRGKRIAGVSAFGFSGTNAHVVLEQAPEVASSRETNDAPQLLVVSAATADAARSLAIGIAERIETVNSPLADVAYTLIAARAQLPWRIAVVASDARQAAQLLRAATPIEAPLQPAVVDLTMREEPQALAGHFLAGARIHARVMRESGARLVDLPVYPFERQRHWIEPAGAIGAAAASARRHATDVTPTGDHPLLGRRLRVPGKTRRHESSLSVDRLPWLGDHRVNGAPALPAAAMLEAFAAVGPQDVAFSLSDVQFNALLPIERTVTLFTETDGAQVSIQAARDGSDDWQALASAAITTDKREARPDVSLAVLQEQIAEPVDIAGFYAAFESGTAIEYGPAFRTVATLLRGSGGTQGQALARLVLPAELDANGMRLHPALLDGAFQSVAAAIPSNAQTAASYLPTGIAHIAWQPQGSITEAWAWTRVTVDAAGVVLADVDLLASDGQPIAQAAGLRLEPDRAARGRRAVVHAVEWERAIAGRELPRTWHVAGADSRVVEGITAHLASGGLTLGSRDDAQGVIFIANEGDDCGELLTFVQALARRDSPPQLWIVTRSSGAGAAAWGFAAAIRQERPQLLATVVDVAAPVDAAALVEAMSHHGEMLRVDSQGIRARAIRPQATANAHFALRRPESGRLGDLMHAPSRVPAPRKDQVAIRVAAAGLNFRDVMNVLGTYPGDAGELGGECAGSVSAIGDGVEGLAPGQRVMAIASGCHASDVVAPASMVLPIPREWTLEQAATSPTVFLTAAVALREVARVQRGQVVLVHAGSGGLGLAAIAIARAAGAEVIATASTEEKRAYLHTQGVTHVSDSRSLAFVAAVCEATGGRGVDIVLNSLSGELIGGGFDALRDGGIFLEVGKAGVWTDEQARAYRPDVAYRRVALDDRIAQDALAVRALWLGLVDEFDRGALRSLPVTTFAMHDAASAYRHMQQARHIGRIALTRRFLRADAAYLVTGGTGALGHATARWLLERGAGEVVLAARRAPANLATLGGNVRFVQADVSVKAEVEKLIASLDRPLAGVIHAAGILDDGVLENLTPERFASVFAPKVDGARHLDAATRATPPDFFVMYASAAGVLGSAGQANYAAANAALDGIAARRRAAGLHALSVDWGAWAGDGLAAGGTRAAMASEPALAALEQLLRDDATQAVVLATPLLVTKTQGDAPASTRKAFRDLLVGLSIAEQRALIANAVRSEVATVLTLPAAALNAQRALNEYGLDSLMAVELRNALAALTQSSLPSSLLFDYPSIEALSAFLAQRLDVEDRKATATASPQEDAHANLTEEELAIALTKELERAGY